MAKTDMKLTTTDTMGNTNTATITYVNPNATSSQLVTLGRMLTSLTSSAYNKTDRINTINCDTEEGGQKTQATITLAKTTDTKTNVLGSTYSLDNQMLSYPIDITYNGDGRLFFGSSSNYIGALRGEQNKIILCSSATVGAISNLITEDVTITVRAEETDNYTAAEATFTVTV